MLLQEEKPGIEDVPTQKINFNDCADKVSHHIRAVVKELSFNFIDDVLLKGTSIELLPAHEADNEFFYVSEKEDIDAVRSLIEDHRNALIKQGHRAEDLHDVDVRVIPRKANGDLDIKPGEHGLLYIPHVSMRSGTERFKGPMQFNWDTAFEVTGLVLMGEVDDAKGLVDNMLYEIEHYGCPLNANATFCLNENGKNRSQLPLLTGKILAIYENWDGLKNDHGDKTAWLKNAIAKAEEHHSFWMTKPHYHEETGLSKFDTADDSPGVEVMFCEPTHYEAEYNKFLEIYATYPEKESLSYEERKKLCQAEWSLEMDEKTGQPKPYKLLDDGRIQGLTSAYFRGDRAMREGAFDVSARYGIGGADIINVLPVCLNSLRYKMEAELAQLYGLIIEAEPDNEIAKIQRDAWVSQSEKTKTAMHQYLWDDGTTEYSDAPQMTPSFRDRYINDEMREKYSLEPFNKYDFASALFPLWVEVADETHARQTVEGLIQTPGMLKTKHGLKTSTTDSGYQWDSWIVWPPLQVIACEGLEKYDFHQDALELAVGYTKMLRKQYKKDGFFYEKMEGRDGTADTWKFVNSDTGYVHNDKGFGWTIGAWLNLQDRIPGMRDCALKKVMDVKCEGHVHRIEDTIESDNE